MRSRASYSADLAQVHSYRIVNGWVRVVKLLGDILVESDFRFVAYSCVRELYQKIGELAFALEIFEQKLLEVGVGDVTPSFGIFQEPL